MMKPISTETQKHLVVFVLIMAGAIGFHWLLRWYLADLANPYPMMLVLWASLVLTLIHDISFSFLRRSMVTVVARFAIFGFGIYLAHWIRTEYISLMTQILEAPEIAELAGSDYLAMAKSKVIGYGGCYGAGLVISKWVLKDRVERQLNRLLGDYTGTLDCCPYCNQAISK